MYGYYLQNPFFIHLASFGVHSNDRLTDRPTDEHTRCMTHQKKWNKQTRKKKDERKKEEKIQEKKRKETGGNNE